MRKKTVDVRPGDIVVLADEKPVPLDVRWVAGRAERVILDKDGTAFVAVEGVGGLGDEDGRPAEVTVADHHQPGVSVGWDDETGRWVVEIYASDETRPVHVELNANRIA
jgi:hypothetical protein